MSKESIVVDLYCKENKTIPAIAEFLSVGRSEVHSILKRANVKLGSSTRSPRFQARNTAILQLKALGWKGPDIALAFNLKPHSVYQISSAYELKDNVAALKNVTKQAVIVRGSASFRSQN